MRSKKIFQVLGLIALVGVTGCRVGGWVASVVGDVVGSKGDAACDRRYVSDPSAEPSAFCQEVIDTVASSQIEDDCSSKFHAKAFDGQCPRENAIGGCKYNQTNDDGSEVYDWYYNVSDLEKERGSEFQSHVDTADDVRAKCADPGRYEGGAEFVEP